MAFAHLAERNKTSLAQTRLHIWENVLFRIHLHCVNIFRRISACLSEHMLLTVYLRPYSSLFISTFPPDRGGASYCRSHGTFTPPRIYRAAYIVFPIPITLRSRRMYLLIALPRRHRSLHRGNNYTPNRPALGKNTQEKHSVPNGNM